MVFICDKQLTLNLNVYIAPDLSYLKRTLWEFVGYENTITGSDTAYICNERLC